MATETPPRNTLINAVTEALQGRPDAARLSAMTATTRGELAQHRQGFADSVAELEPAVVEQVQPFIQATHDVFGVYEHALDLLDRYVQTPEANLLVQGAEQLQRAIFQINRCFSSYRDAVLIAQGPTDMPSYNLLLQGLREWREGQSIDKVRVVIEQERIVAKMSLDKLAQDVEVPEVAELKRAFQTHLDTATRLGKAARDGDEAYIDQETDHLRDTFAALKVLIPAAEQAVRSHGPSPSALVNQVIDTGRRYAAGRALPVEFYSLLEQLRRTIRSAESQFDLIAPQAASQPRYQGLAEAGREAFSLYERAFALCNSRIVENLDKAFGMLLEASKAQHAVQQSALDLMEESSRVPCIKCGHRNAGDRNRCEKCGTALPVRSHSEGSLLGTGDATDKPVLSDTLRRLYDAVNGVTDGSTTVASFAETVQWFEELVESHIAAAGSLRDQTRGKELTPEVEQAVASGDQRYATFQEQTRQAIAAFQAFVQDGDKMHLYDGVQLCNKGAHELLRMEKIVSEAAPAEGAAPAESSEGAGTPPPETDPTPPLPDAMFG